MNYSKCISLLALTALGVGLHGGRSAPPRFRIVLLPSYGNADGDVHPTGVNARGDVVGQLALPGDSQPRAVLWHDGKVETLGCSGGQRAVVTGINDDGVAIGTLLNAHTADRAVAWKGTKIYRTGPEGSSGWAINSNDVAAARAKNKACLWEISRNRWTALPDFVPRSINARGEVVGIQIDDSHVPFFHPVVWRRGKLRHLATGRDEEGEATGINARGEIVGGTEKVGSHPERHAVFWKGGKRTDLGNWRGGPAAPHLRAVGEEGWAVGCSQQVGEEAFAVLHDGNRFYSLLELCDGAKGWSRLADAGAIGSDGRITGFGFFEGKPRAFRLDPIR